MYTISMRSIDNNRFRLNAFSSIQDSNSSIRSDEDFKLGCIKLATFVRASCGLQSNKNRAVRDLNC